MGPEVTIKAIELIQGNFYQIDLMIGDSGDRMFIRQSELLKLLSEANLKAEEETDKQEWIEVLKKVISGEIDCKYMFKEDSDVPYTKEQAQKELDELLN